MTDDDIHTKRKGDISEQKAITKLLELGVEVYTPVGENTRADLIYQKSDELVRVQVKTGRKKNGCVVFNCAKIHSNSTEHRRSSYQGDVEEFIIYHRDNDQLYIVSIDELPETEMRFRIEESESPYASYHNVNWGKDYKLVSRNDLMSD